MRPLDPHPTPLLLPCVRCYHRGACAWDGTAQAEEIRREEAERNQRGKERFQRTQERRSHRGRIGWW